MGDPQGRILLYILHPGPEGGPVAHGGPDLLRRIAHYDGDVPDAALHQLLDGVEEDGLVGDGDQLLGVGVGEGPQAAALPAAQDEPLQGAHPPAFLL